MIMSSIRRQLESLGMESFMNEIYLDGG